VLVRSVPLDGGVISPDQMGGDPTPLGSLLGASPRAGLDLPCRSGDADLWFAEAPAELERAKVLCGGCAIRAECLAGALSREEPWGVWGGEIFERGVVIPRKRPRGRPSKADLARDRAYAAAGAASA
jgi:WhiB family transcriptional regulator, redox-sensing transcriptional regulator